MTSGKARSRCSNNGAKTFSVSMSWLCFFLNNDVNWSRFTYQLDNPGGTFSKSWRYSLIGIADITCPSLNQSLRPGYRIFNALMPGSYFFFFQTGERIVVPFPKSNGLREGEKFLHWWTWQKCLYFNKVPLDVREMNCDNILGHILHFKTTKGLCFMEQTHLHFILEIGAVS